MHLSRESEVLNIRLHNELNVTNYLLEYCKEVSIGLTIQALKAFYFYLWQRSMYTFSSWTS